MSSSPSRSSPAPPEKPAPAQFNPAQYSQYPQYQPMPMPQPMYQSYPSNNDVPRPSKTWNISKVILGSLIIILDIVLIAMGGAMLATIYAWYSWTFSYIIVACVAAASLIWQIAEFITLCVRRHYMGIHPGAHVGVHLILWLGCCVLVALTGIITHVDMDNLVDCYTSDSDYYSCYDGDGDASLSGVRAFLRMEQAELALSSILLICHFVLFVLACIETDRRNKAARVPRTVYVVAPPPGHASVYYAPAPAQGMPQPYQYPPMQFMPQQPQQPQPARVNGGDSNNAAAYGYYAPPGAPVQTQPVRGPVAEHSSSPVSSVAGPSGSNTHGRVDVEHI